ncbi:DUF6891 domain-containing protein [Paractinoplanes atraurantiacus]|uniref:DUF6891 domain-containing protein n=1 Tax=Paractinoplanes atraurantiacus TaxID=1036182 RepID=A0A285K8Y4_9ACTN|nr:hypothetical protein [Actinoplanes atraurantiacus]SNY68447.1 hypothetical protein SAMN05421748_13326 [Actinoplanes atraurantiacus]
MTDEWIYNRRPDGARFLPDRVAEPARTEIEDDIWSWVVRGEDDADEFADYLDGDEVRDGITDEELASAYDQALAVRRTQQAGWGTVRSNLTLAFAELNDLGVLARQNFACCGNCAAVEIHDERDDSRHWHGYLWFHEQDTESLIASEDGSVYLGYGVYDEQADFQAAVERLMDEVVFPVLRRHGMRPEWNRNLATRILVTGAQWYAPVG